MQACALIDETETRVYSCQDCGAHAPASETNYTVITSRYGWRLTRVRTAQGTREVQWRCPRCWACYRAQVSQTA